MPRPPKTKPAAQRNVRRAPIEADQDTPRDELQTPNRAVFTSSFELHPSNSAPALPILRDTLLPKVSNAN
jgi:hypothetical protein